MRTKRLSAALLAFLMLAFQPAIFAHGDEDHGGKKPAVAAGPGMIARTARAGDYEVMMKHPVLEPLHEHAARVFVTRYATNEAVKGATVNLVIAVKGKAPIKVAAKASANSGEYELILPPLDAGAYNFTAEVGVAGARGTANYGAVAIEPPQPTETDSGWAGLMNAVLWQSGVLFMALISVMSYRAWHRRAVLLPES